MRRPTQHVQSRLHARAGFTLAELLVALMVFSVGALAMVATSANVMTLITASKNRVNAAQGQVIDLSSFIEPGSVQSALATGIRAMQLPAGHRDGPTPDAGWT